MSGPAPTVLVVEDAAEVRSVLALGLASAGFHVLAARDAAEALALCLPLADAPCLLVCDFILEGGTGLDVAAQLGRLYPGLRVLFVSGYHRDALLERGLPVDHTHFLAKPFGVSELVAAARALLAEPVESGAV